MTSELLQQVRVIDPVSGTDQLADVLIADGSIKAVEHQISDWSTETLLRDCRGLVLGPGLVDLYSHSGEPGFEERETLASLVSAAAAGGFTRLSILPDTMPPIDNLAGLARLQGGWGAGEPGSRGEYFTSAYATPVHVSGETLWSVPSKGDSASDQLLNEGSMGSPPSKVGLGSQAADAPALHRTGMAPSGDRGDLPPTPLAQEPLCSSAPLLYFWAALTVGVQGQQTTELAELAAASNVVGFADGQPLGNLALLRRLLEYFKPLGKPVALWPCDRHLVGDGVMREGSYSVRFGLPGNPTIAETASLAAILELVAATGTPVHIMRVSTARSVQLIQDAKARGLPITVSTTWMHLLLDTKAVSSYNTNLRTDPPLGNPSDLVSLRQAVRMGIVDAIAIDHTPYTYEEKTVAFAEAPPGAIGLELALPLLWHNLVETGELTALELWRCLSTRPAECLQQTPSAIAPGKPAELTLFAPHATWTVERQTLHGRSANTPWLGQQLSGRVVQTWLGAIK